MNHVLPLMFKVAILAVTVLTLGACTTPAPPMAQLRASASASLRAPAWPRQNPPGWRATCYSSVLRNMPEHVTLAWLQRLRAAA